MTMRKIQKSIITLSLVSTFSLAAATEAAQGISKQEEEKNVLVGMGSGALIGAGIAGPVGGVVGGLLGIFIGEDVSNDTRTENLQARLGKSEAELVALQNEYQQTLIAYKQLKAEQGKVQVAGLQKEPEPVALSALLNSEANIQFKTASWQLEQHYIEQLDKVAEKLKRDPKLVVQLFGYADRRGAQEYNLELSEKRAEQVKHYLLSQGVETAQIETAGYGEAQPVTVQQTWENDFFDRRVVVRLTSEDAVMTARHQGN